LPKSNAYSSEWAVETRYGPSSNRGSCPDGFVNSGHSQGINTVLLHPSGQGSRQRFRADPVIELWVFFLMQLPRILGCYSNWWRSLCEIFSPTESYLTGVEIVPSPLRTVKQLLQIASDASGHCHGQSTPERDAHCTDHHSSPRRACRQSTQKCETMPMKRQLQRGSILYRCDDCD